MAAAGLFLVHIAQQRAGRFERNIGLSARDQLPGKTLKRHDLHRRVRRRAIDLDDRNAVLPQRLKAVQHKLRQIFGIRHDQRVVGGVAHQPAPVFEHGGFQLVGRHDVEIQLMIKQLDRRPVVQHTVLARPLALGVIEQRDARHAVAVKERAHGVGVAHQLGKGLELRVFAVRVEMRRAVRIGIDRREGVRHEPVHAAHQQIVDQPLHHGRILRPAVRAEDLAHGAVVHMRPDVRQRRRELAQHILEERRISPMPRADGRADMMRKAGHDLMQHDVYAGHVLPLERAEVVSRRAAQTGVRVLILDDVADVHNAVRAAPVAHTLCKALAVERRYNVHIRLAQLDAALALIPEKRQNVGHVASHLGGEAVEHIGAPRHGQAGLAGLCVVKAAAGHGAEHIGVADARLVREKAHQLLAEILADMAVVRFVDRLDEHIHGGRVQHIDVRRFRPPRAGVRQPE